MAVEPQQVEGSVMHRLPWIWDFVRPFNLITLFIGLTGILMAVYFYHDSAFRPELSWKSLNQIVFDYSSTHPDITVVDKQGNKITENMYASQFTIWNSGNVRLDNVDPTTLIREPLSFRLKGAGHIVSASIAGRRNDTSGGWTLETVPSATIMSWRHFDPGAAVRILVVYTGDRDTSIEPSILVAGYSTLHPFGYGAPPKMPNIFLYVGIGIMMVTVPTSFVMLRARPGGWLLSRRRYITQGGLEFVVMVAILSVVLVIIWLWNFYRTVVATTPDL